MTTFTKTILFTDTDGLARWREEPIALTEGKPMARLSPLMASGGYQLRESPVGFRSEFHCTENPQWVFILRGRMEIGLRDGSSRVFGPGEHFYSADVVPAGQAFDPQRHGHWSRQVGDEPLQTLFVRAGGSSVADHTPSTGAGVGSHATQAPGLRQNRVSREGGDGRLRIE